MHTYATLSRYILGLKRVYVLNYLLFVDKNIGKFSKIGSHTHLELSNKTLRTSGN